MHAFSDLCKIERTDMHQVKAEKLRTKNNPPFSLKF